MPNSEESDIPEDPTRIVIIQSHSATIELDPVAAAITADSVVLVPTVSPDEVDDFMYRIADSLGLNNTLKLHAGFANFLGHRHRIGKYFMSVNRRADYQFITPHSEGTRFAGIQLAAFYCCENSTDGGETILMNVDDESSEWSIIRDRVLRGCLQNGPLSRGDNARARSLHQLNLPADLLKNDDRILRECPTNIPSLKVLEVLARPEKLYSRILDRCLNVYWDSIDSADFDSAREWMRLLRKWGLLKKPPGQFDVIQLDESAGQRVWRSGVNFGRLFRCKLTRKLVPGDLVIHNNLTWTHANNNWSPGSGVRRMAAAFA